MAALDTDFEEQGPIGGLGKVVEIDECKIGRRKFERGRVVEGSWILGLIERGCPENYRLEICPDNKRDKDTLLSLIKKNIKPGTEIHTDCWKGYIGLEAEGYIHKTVNHSEQFVDSVIGAHTQNIESSWRSMRRNLSRGGVHKAKLDEHLCEICGDDDLQSISLTRFHYYIKTLGKYIPETNLIFLLSITKTWSDTPI